MTLDRKVAEIYVPVVTPILYKDVSEKELLPIVERTRQAGIKGEFYMGETGESRFLTDPQKYTIVDFISTIRQGDVQMIVGTTCDSLRHTVKLTKYAQDKGFEAFVLNPQYQTEMPPIEFVRAVLEHSDMPLVIYNNPWICNGRSFHPGDLAVLVNQYDERIKGIKDSSANLDYLKQLTWIRDNIASWLMVYQGSEEALIADPEFHSGEVDGLVAGTANFSPKLIVGIWNKIKQKKYDDLEMNVQTLKEYHEAYIKAGGSVQVIKRYLHDKGLIMSQELTSRKKAA